MRWRPSSFQYTSLGRGRYRGHARSARTARPALEDSGHDMCATGAMPEAHANLSARGRGAKMSDTGAGLTANTAGLGGKISLQGGTHMIDCLRKTVATRPREQVLCGQPIWYFAIEF